MKKIMVAVLALAMLLSALAVMADGEKSFSITPRVAANIAVDKDTKDNVGNQFGVLADIDVASLPVGFETGFLGGQKSTDVDILGLVDVDQKVTTWSVPVLVTYEYPFSDQFYAKAGAGINIIHTKAQYETTTATFKYDEDYSKTKTNFAFKLGFGYKFANNFSAELMYQNSGKVKYDMDLPSGVGGEVEYKTSFVQFNVGYTF